MQLLLGLDELKAIDPCAGPGTQKVDWMLTLDPVTGVFLALQALYLRSRTGDMCTSEG